MLDVRKLRMLATLDRLGTIAAAAAELRLTAPGVSMQLGALERELDVKLIERHGRGVILTPAGLVLARHGHEIVDRVSLAESEVGALRAGAVGSYTVSAFPSAARTFVADAWSEILSSADRIELQLVTDEPESAIAALASGASDIAVTHSYSNVPRDHPADLSVELIATEPVWLAERTDAAGSSSADLRDYVDAAWITPAQSYTCFDMVQRACGRAGFRPRVLAETMDFAAQLALVAAGVGVALVPQLTVASLPAGVTLRPLLDPLERHFFVCGRASAEVDPGFRRIRDSLRTAALARVAAPFDK